jgi:hypothetical protein
VVLVVDVGANVVLVVDVVVVGGKVVLVVVAGERVALAPLLHAANTKLPTATIHHVLGRLTLHTSTPNCGARRYLPRRSELCHAGADGGRGKRPHERADDRRPHR